MKVFSTYEVVVIRKKSLHERKLIYSSAVI